MDEKGYNRAVEDAEYLRFDFEGAWGPDTALPGSNDHGDHCLSTGQCAATAIAIWMLREGVELRSTYIDDQSHWYVNIDGYDIDITADQFGMGPVQVARQLYPKYRVRQIHDANEETLRRAGALLLRIGL